MALLPNGLPLPIPAQAVAYPQVVIDVLGPQQLNIQSNIPIPGGWAEIVKILLAAAQVAHQQEQAELAQTHEARRIVVPQGVVVG